MKRYKIAAWLMIIHGGFMEIGGVLCALCLLYTSTICDCFKYRTKLDNEMFNKALNAYAVDKKKNLSNLSRYAQKMRVYKKLMDVMEVLLNG